MRAIQKILLTVMAVNILATGCASRPPAVTAIPGRPEYVSTEMFGAAQREAARLSGDTLSADGAPAPTIVQLPIGQLCELLGQCPHAAAYDRNSRTAYFRDDRPWLSDRAHSFGIVIHEAAHSLQDDTMSPECREAQAHEIQVAWLIAQRAEEMAEQVRENGARYVCETALAAVMPW